MMSVGKLPETKPGRLGALARLPLFFSLQGKRAAVAGGSAAAAWKAELLAAAGAEVAVYAIDVSAAMKTLALDTPDGRVVINRRAWTATDLRGAAVAIGDFEDEPSAAAFRQAACALGVSVNVIDRPAFCDFSFGAIVNRSPLVVGISTDGAAPALAQAIRNKIEALLPSGFAIWTATAARWREAIKLSSLSRVGRRRFWELFVAHALARPNGAPHSADFDRLLVQAGAEGATRDGAITLVVVDPDNPDLLTLRAVRALHAADTILYDACVPAEALDFARREARKILICGTVIGRVRGWHDIEALSASGVGPGERVVLMTSLHPTAGVRERLSSAA